MTTHFPPISIIIPTYNRSKILAYTLDSICRQDIEASHFEVLIVDDGSSDDTRQMAESYASRLSVRYFYQEDRGYRVGSARNEGIRNAMGQILVFIDSGVILHSGCIRSHLAAHAGNLHPTAVVGYVYDFKREREEDEFLVRRMEQGGGDDVIESLAATGHHSDLREPVYAICDSNISLLPAPWVLFWTCNVSATKSAILSAGGFDINYDGRWGMEDVDLGYNLFREGVFYSLSREAAAIHYPHVTNTREKLEQEKINKVYFHQKHNMRESEALLNFDTVELNLHLAGKMNSVLIKS